MAMLASRASLNGTRWQVTKRISESQYVQTNAAPYQRPQREDCKIRSRPPKPTSAPKSNIHFE